VLDPVALAQSLIRCASVTPADAGALDLVTRAAAGMGFTVHRLTYEGTPNLFCRRGKEGPHLCFAGHTDVVPPGTATWSADPFGGEIRDGVLFGRGACDMKGAVAAFLAAVSRQPMGLGSVSLLITGDEEGPATGGTVRVLEWMAERGHIPDFCLVGEPTNPGRLGEVVKIGRRGSINARITVTGVQGHVAYPARVDNPVHRLVAALAEIAATRLDEGTEWFEPTSLQVTSVDVGNAATNLVPASASARLNIRFNDRQTGASLEAWLRSVVARHAKEFGLEAVVSGEAFLTSPGRETTRLSQAIESVTGLVPKMDTGGGTSDARFISRYCPVAEFGLVGATMHMTDENVPVADLESLTRIYEAVLGAFAA
jgi:succinyl-diaminopimelate desuccinylase